jgi:putative hydrolase of the HAD superfamily
VKAVTTIGFDADDTLWQNEQFFRITEQRFADLIAPHVKAVDIHAALLATEQRNLDYYGYGVKGFTLSLIETAIELTEGRVPAAAIETILQWGREMLRHPLETLPHVHETLAQLDRDYRLILITKGDLFDQERKLAASGLGDWFDGVEIVSEKTPQTYTRIFARHGDGPERAMMVGNSLKSDVIPAITAGAWGVYVPHDMTWVHEHAEEPSGHPHFARIAHLGELPGLLHQITSG